MTRDELKDEPTGFWELDEADGEPLELNLTASETFAVLALTATAAIVVALILGT